MKHRIVEVTKADGSKVFRCERTGFFRRNVWRPMTLYASDLQSTFAAEFPSFAEAQRFLGIHPSQIIKSEKVIEQ